MGDVMFRSPTKSEWGLTAIATLVFAAIASAFSVATGLFQFRLIDDYAGFLRLAVIALLMPALLEEVIFRGPIIWVAKHRKSWLFPAAIVSLVLFVLWHPVNGVFIMVEARELFTDWRFLSVAAFLGVVATWLALKANSIWPSIAFHWLAVVGWKVFLGGPQFLSS